LTEQQIEALTAAGDRVVNDAVHQDLCMCDAWPEKCLSTGNYYMGAWDVSGLTDALPAVLALWEQMRGGELVALRARVAELEAGPAGAERTVDEDPIAFTLTNRAVVPAGFCRNESPYGRRCDLTAGHEGDHAMADGAGGHFGWPASDDDVRPQVRKLRNLLAGQRAEAGERP
jgi:hypothetical protein